jgi:hypothetical protein
MFPEKTDRESDGEDTRTNLTRPFWMRGFAGRRVHSFSLRLAETQGVCLNFRYLKDGEARQLWLGIRKYLELDTVLIPGRLDPSLNVNTTEEQQMHIYITQKERKNFRKRNHRKWFTFWMRDHTWWVDALTAIMVVTGNGEALLQEVRR